MFFVDFGANVEEDRKVGRVSLLVFRVLVPFFLGSAVVLLVSGVDLLVNNDDVTALSLASVIKGFANIVVAGFLDVTLVSLPTEVTVKGNLDDSSHSFTSTIDDARFWYACFAGVSPLKGLTEQFFGVFDDLVVVASFPSTGKTSGLFLGVGWIVE